MKNTLKEKNNYERIRTLSIPGVSDLVSYGQVGPQKSS